MKFQPTLKSWTKLGVPAVAAGFIFFAGPVNSEASELGDDLIQKGQESSQVESLQELLSDKGTLNSSAVSGSFGKETKSAVTAYQEKHNLAVDGIAGPQTIGALEVLKHGSTGQPVENLQEDLSDLGLYTIEVDGIYGDKTEKAVKEFQSKSGISADGLAGPETFGALHAVNTKAPSSSEAAPAPESSASTAESKEKAPVEEKSSSEDTSSEDTSSEDTSSQEAAQAEEAEEQEAAERQVAQEEAAAQEAAEQEAAEQESAAEQAAEEADSAEAENAAEQEAAQAEQSAEEAEELEEAAQAAAAEEAAEQEAAQAAAAQEEAEEQEAAEAAAAEQEAAEQEAAEQEAAEAAQAEEEASEEVVESSSSEASSETEASGDSFTAEATAYTAFCTGCSGTTATGVDLRANPNQNVIAVDPNVIPLGSTVEVEGMGTFTAADTGGAINGNRIDIFMEDRGDAVSFGRQNLEVTVID